VYVTIDPGLQTGWAIWRSNRLVACGLGDPRSSKKHVVHAPDGVDADVIADLWIESQIIYPRSKVPPDDIRKLAFEAGRWAGIYETLGCDAHCVAPSEWKGQVPKDIHHARILAVLTETERTALDEGVRGVAPSKQHNVLDAVGLGLWVAKRVAR